MRHEEMDKLTIWLAGAFPSWKPDKCVAAVWADELPDVPAENAIAAVRRLQGNKPTPFPPGIFEICGALKGRCDPHREALMLFSHFWNGGAAPDPEVARLATSMRARRALRLAAGRDGYGKALTADRDWHEKRYCEIYEGLAEREAMAEQRQQLAAPHTTIETLLLEAPRESGTADSKSRIAGAKEGITSALLKLYPSGKVPDCDLSKVRRFIAAQMKCSTGSGESLKPIGDTMKTALPEGNDAR